MPLQKATIAGHRQALCYTVRTPQKERYLHVKEELDHMKMLLGGRAAEQIVFAVIANGASNDLERVTMIASSMVFEYEMSDEFASRTSPSRVRLG